MAVCEGSDGRIRHVWIVWRPLTAFGWSSRDQLVLSHWGVLVTTDDYETISTLHKEVHLARKHEYDLTVGELWQLCRVGKQNQSRRSDFGLSEMKEWTK